MNAIQRPSYLQNLPKRDLAHGVTVNLGVSSPPYLSIQGNRFVLVDGAGNQRAVTTVDQSGPYVDVVLIDRLERVSKIFYGSDFNPGAASYQPPDCFSDNGVGPSRQASNPQSPTCADCPQNVWGSETSRVTGKGIKACSDYQKVALIVPGMEQVFLLRIPPNSLKNFRSYAAQFHGRDFDFDSVLTRISFVSQGTLQFAPLGWAPEAMAPFIIQAVTDRAADGLLGRHDMPKEGVALPSNRPSAQIEHKQVEQITQPVEQEKQNGPANPPRRRGRPPAEKMADPVPGTTTPTTAPFRPNPPPMAGVEAQKTEAPANAPFGMQQDAKPPTGDIARDLNSVFGLKS